MIQKLKKELEKYKGETGDKLKKIMDINSKLVENNNRKDQMIHGLKNKVVTNSAVKYKLVKVTN